MTPPQDHDIVQFAGEPVSMDASEVFARNYEVTRADLIALAALPNLRGLCLRGRFVSFP